MCNFIVRSKCDITTHGGVDDLLYGSSVGTLGLAYLGDGKISYFAKLVGPSVLRSGCFFSLTAIEQCGLSYANPKNITAILV